MQHFNIKIQMQSTNIKALHIFFTAVQCGVKVVVVRGKNELNQHP